MFRAPEELLIDRSRWGDGGVAYGWHPPGLERLAVGEAGGLAPLAAGGCVTTGDLFFEQDPQHLGGGPNG